MFFTSSKDKANKEITRINETRKIISLEIQILFSEFSIKTEALDAFRKFNAAISGEFSKDSVPGPFMRYIDTVIVACALD